MSSFARSPVIAVLGPTNTGKTHLAVERMCGHSSGIMGFPLRLLAREIYDRVVAIKGEKLVGLVTGEEKILPPDARYLLCTVESMPVPNGANHGVSGGDAAFVAIDEAQLGSDPERGHVFTDRLLRARGREETMILGSATLTPMVRKLVPDAEIIGRPRFSTLAYAGTRKLSRLPKRSAIVAFSAEEVYALAETIRRLRGGAAVVMGALSPRTRNAQVAMFQSGEVDYLVATDAIGMGLNMDVAHVAFAGLTKFDGRRQRRLTVAEMAQIAGRAGRHQHDGSFGFIGSEGASGFTPQEIEAIEQHRFPSLPHLFWRDGTPRLDSIETLVGDLEAPPDRPELRAAPLATDLAVLKLLAAEQDVADPARSPEMVRRLWEVCGLPDFQKMGADQHARIVHRLWKYRAHGTGYVDADWFGSQVRHLDTTDGNVEEIAARVAAVRTWAYIAQRADWLEDPGAIADRTRAIETRLSDALHERLTQRFVDRRTAILLRDLGQGSASLPVAIDSVSGRVLVDGEHIGQLEGFRFSVHSGTKAGDRKLLFAAAERHLKSELKSRAAALAVAKGEEIELDLAPGHPPSILWRGHPVARLSRGRHWLAADIALERAIASLDRAQVAAIAERLRGWLDAHVRHVLGALVALAATARSAESAPALRAVLAPLDEAGGILARATLDAALEQLGRDARAPLRRLGLVIGSLDLYHPAALKPAPARLRATLLSLHKGKASLSVPLPGAVLAEAHDDSHRQGAALAGFRGFGTQFLRIDMVERLARQAHEIRVRAESPQPPPLRISDNDSETEPQKVEPNASRHGARRRVIDIPASLATSLGLTETSRTALLRAIGFRPTDGAAEPGWVWHGRPNTAQRRKPSQRKPTSPAPRPSPLKTRSAVPQRQAMPPRNPHSPFAALSGLFAKPEKHDA